MCVYECFGFFKIEKTWIKFKCNSQMKHFLRDKITFSIFVTMFLSEVSYYADDAAFFACKTSGWILKETNQRKAPTLILQ